MVTQVDIANMALGVLDETPIDSMEDDNKAARLLNLHFETTREAELSAHLWAFAIFTADLVGTDMGDCAWEYELPADFLRLIPLTYDNTAHGVPISWEVRDGKLFSDQESPRGFRYIANLTDPDDWDALFTEVFVSSLALKIALPLTHKTGMLEIAQNAYDRALDKALTVNATQRSARLYDAGWDRQRGDTRYWRA